MRDEKLYFGIPGTAGTHVNGVPVLFLSRNSVTVSSRVLQEGCNQWSAKTCRGVRPAPLRGTMQAACPCG